MKQKWLKMALVLAVLLISKTLNAEIYIVNEKGNGNNELHSHEAPGVNKTNEPPCSPSPTISISPTLSAVCLNSPTTLNTSSTNTSTYKWSPSTNLTSSTAAKPIATPTVTTTYTVTATSANGCTATSSTVITVNPLPTASAGSAQTICASASANLKATGGTKYSWSPTTGLTTPTTATTIATPTATTLYTVSVTDGNGCSKTASVNVTVSPLPNVSATTPNPVCANATTASFGISSPGSSTYSWSPTTGLSNPTSATTTATPTATTTYTVTGKLGICSATSSVVVIANPLPSAGPAQAICLNNSTNLSATGGITYSWAPASSLSVTNISNPKATPTATTTYTLSATSANGCTATSSTVITVNPLPTASAGKDQTICANASANLIATGGTTYSWAPATGLATPTAATITVTPTVTTAYTVTVTNANNCSASASVNVIVNPIPRIMISPLSGSTTICAGGSATLSAGGSSNSYIWTGNLPNGSSVSPTTTTTYTVTGTLGSCTATHNFLVTVIPLPNLSPSYDDQICQGGNTQLNLGNASNVNYKWSPTVGLSNSNIANPIANPTATTTYTVTATTTVGSCTATNSVNLTVFSNPVPNIAPNIVICEGSPLTILDGTPAIHYITGPNSYSSETGIIVNKITNSATLANAGIYNIIEEDPDNGCTSNATVTVTVNPLPIANAGADQTICNGDRTRLTATGGSSYIWNTSATTASISVSPTFSIHGQQTSYTVTVSDGKCSATDQVVVTVQIPNANEIFNQTICSGACTSLGFNGGGNFIWSTGETTPTITVCPTYNAANPNTTYTVTISQGACTQVTSGVVTVLPSPIVTLTADPIICFNGTTNVNAICAGGTSPYTYLWNDATTGASDPNVHDGTHIVTVTDSKGCTNITGTLLQNPAPIIVSLNANPILCPHGTTTIFTTVTGETKDYSYLWGDGSTASTFPNAGPVVYGVTVTDKNNCIGVKVINIPPAPADIVVSLSGNPIKCNGGTTTITATTTGGTPGYNYSWNNIAGGNVLQNAAAGGYTVVVSDKNGCIEYAGIGFDNPAPLAATLTIVQNNFTIQPTNGVAPYTFVWPNGYNSTGNSSTTVLSVHDMGPVTITDANGCTGTFPVNKANKSLSSQNGSSTGVNENSDENKKISIYPNPANTNITIEYSFDDNADASISLINILGSKVLEQKIIGSNHKMNLDISNLPNGIYVYSIIKDGAIIEKQKLIISK